MNPLNDPIIVYMKVVLANRIDRLRNEDRGLGVSAIEWAIITGMVAAIAILIYAVIRTKITDTANSIPDSPVE